MARRCPGARSIGRAELHNWRFHVNIRGSASIIPSDDSVVHGVLWRCSAAHFHRLDKYEGVSWGNYRRRHVSIVKPCGASESALVYAGTRIYDGRARVRYMATAVLPGAKAFALPESYIEELLGWLPDRPIGEKRAQYHGSARPVRHPR